MKKYLPIFLILLLLSSFLSACAPSKTPVVVFCAGSLMVPIQELETAYEAAHPDVDIQAECHGSIQVIRHVTELHESIDLVLTADHALIPKLMYQSTIPDTDQPYADWYIRFAGNRMALAYTAESQYSDEINAENWYEVIIRPGVRIGLSDPRFDASGYRTMMILDLAGKYYDTSSLFGKIFGGQFTSPVTREDENGVTVIHIPEVLETIDGGRLVMRGSSVALLSLLEAGEIDYAFEYQSVISQHGFQMVEFPPELSLGDPAQADFYNDVEVRMDFQRFQSVNPDFTGEPIGYGATIPTNAPHASAAADFLAFILGPDGRAIMQKNAQPILDPPLADGYDAMPELLKPLCEPMPES